MGNKICRLFYYSNLRLTVCICGDCSSASLMVELPLILRYYCNITNVLSNPLLHPKCTAYFEVTWVEIGFVHVGFLVAVMPSFDDRVEEFCKHIITLFVSSNASNGHNEWMTFKISQVSKSSIVM